MKAPALLLQLAPDRAHGRMHPPRDYPGKLGSTLQGAKAGLGVNNPYAFLLDDLGSAPARDTLFRTITTQRRRYDETQFIYAYKGTLNFQSWSIFAGSMVYVVITESEMEGERVKDFAAGDFGSYQSHSREPILS